MQIPAFFIELTRRLFAKTPIFFKILQIIGIAAGTLVHLPEILHALGIPADFKIGTVGAQQVVTVCSIAIVVVAQLTVSDDSKLKGVIRTK